MWQNVRQWFQSISPREQLLVLAAAAALTLMLAWFGAIAPYLHWHDGLEQRVAQKRELVAWMQESATRIRALEGTGTAPVHAGGSLFANVNLAAQNAGLAGSMKRISPEGDTSVRVRMEGASFDSLIRWLADLDRGYGVSVDSISIDRAEQDGTVNASITLKGGQ
ncbi:MAG: type II secretion system protein M [Gammaproteobacteria bacterium]|jgi:general secretion pathway protein M